MSLKQWNLQMEFPSLPHKLVIQKKLNQQSYELFMTLRWNLRQVFLNSCLKKGPPLQNKLWIVLLKSRFHPVVLCADIEKSLFANSYLREREIVLDFIGLKLLPLIKLRSAVLLAWCLDLHSHLIHIRRNFACLFWQLWARI